MKILLIDNFDSFTYNLYQYLGEIAGDIVTVRNTDVPLEDIRTGQFSHIVISPGPGNPTEPAYFGDCKQVIEEFHMTYPILGICLGHQGIGAAFGANIVQAPVIMHGKTSTFSHSGQGLFVGLPTDVTVMRYHSLVVDQSTLSPELIVDAAADDGSIMAFHHKDYPTHGLQFHPESFGTATGKQILTNFLRQTPHKPKPQL
jgi:anthranilate synthase component 2